MSVATRRRGCLLLVATLVLITVGGLPVAPLDAEPVAPQTRAATVDGLGQLAPVDPDARGSDRGGWSTAATDEPVRAGVIEAPMPFVSVGITGAGPEPHLRVRTRDLDGQWSDWTEVHVEDAHAPDAGTAEAARAAERSGWATELVWAGPSDRVEVEATGTAPTRLEANFIDTTGLSESVVERVGRWARSLTVGGQPLQAAEGDGLRPDIVTRQEWGANEDWRSGTPVEREVKFGVLHHTVNSNGYSRAEADDLVRSIYHYHAETRGWNDIGYNFLVDRYGTIYEGRYGGMDKGIQGAHAAGWNAGSFGVSVIGNFNDHNPPTVAVEAVADIFAWKYAVHGLDPDPDARVSHNGYEIRTQESHRNVRDGYVMGSNDPAFQEDCPGRWLYWQTPNIRDGIEQRLDSAFTDVGNDHPFHTDIVWAAATGLTDGYRDGSFRPTRPVSRQAMAALMHRLAGEPAPDGTAGFSDVGADHPFHDAITWAAEEGITEGYPDGTYRPTDDVARQAVAAFLHRLAGEPAPDGSAGFSDVGTDHPFHDAIAWAAEGGIADGYPDGAYRPSRDVARQAGTAFLHRLGADGIAEPRVVSLDVQAEHDTVTVEEDNPLTATVVDQEGAPVEDVTVDFTGGQGSFTDPSAPTTTEGTATTAYVPSSADEGSDVTVTARVEGEANEDVDQTTFRVEAEPDPEPTTEST